MVIAAAALVALALLASLWVIVPLVRPATLMTLALVSTCFSGHWDLLGIPVPPDRLLYLAAVASLLLRREFDITLLHPRHLTLAALALYAIVSLASHQLLLDDRSLFALLDHLGVVPFSVVVMGPMMYRSSSDLRFLRIALVALAAYLGVTALLEMVGPTGLVFPRYITNPAIGLHFGRARGPFVAAAPMGLALCLGAGAAALSLRAGTSRLHRTLYVVVGGLALLGIVLTLTRAIWLGATLMIAYTVVAYPEARRLLRRALPVGVVIVLAAVLVLPGLLARVTERGGDQRPLWDRLNTNTAAVAMIRDHPLFGVGYERFRAESPTFIEQQPDYPLTGAEIEVHNILLLVTAELGVVGLSLWLLAVATSVVAPLTRRRDAAVDDWRHLAIAFALAWFASSMFSPSADAFPNLAVWLMCGIVGGLPVAAPEPAVAPEAFHRVPRTVVVPS